MTSDSRLAVLSFLSQAQALQSRFELVEKTATLLDQMLDAGTGLHESLDNTFEAHAFAVLRIQLFRVFTVDLCAAVLDSTRGSLSLAKMSNQLRLGSRTTDLLRAYYCEPTSFRVEVEAAHFSEQEKKIYTDQLLMERINEERDKFNDRLMNLPDIDAITKSNEAKRLKWARDKAIAHYETTVSSAVALSDLPPHGEGHLTWNEPILFLKRIKPVMYDVFLLVMATSWTRGYFDSYAQAFWDRLANGRTEITPASKRSPHGAGRITGP